MSLSPEKLTHITYPQLPLAVYREIAAHLRQIKGVNVCLIPQDTSVFNYEDSQIQCLEIQWEETPIPAEQTQLKAILDYYAQVHGAYEQS